MALVTVEVSVPEELLPDWVEAVTLQLKGGGMPAPLPLTPGGNTESANIDAMAPLDRLLMRVKQQVDQDIAALETHRDQSARAERDAARKTLMDQVQAAAKPMVAALKASGGKTHTTDTP